MRRCPVCSQLLGDDGTCPYCLPSAKGDLLSGKMLSSTATVGPLPLQGPLAFGAVNLRSQARDERIGRIIGGRYKVLEFIGEGGMGQVYRARHLTLHKDVCIKVLRSGRDREHDAVRFQREAHAAGRLRDPRTREHETITTRR